MLIKTIINVFRIEELRKKILFTIGMLAVYRIGFWIPVPGVDQSALTQFFEAQAASGGAAGKVMQYVAIFSGGSFGQSTIFGLGIMPYITAAIIFQLFQSVSPQLKKLKAHGFREDSGMDPLCDGGAVCSSGGRVALVYYQVSACLWRVVIESAVVGHGCHRAHRGHDFPDVARRTDRPVRYR